jgi:hypothetical protein
MKILFACTALCLIISSCGNNQMETDEKASEPKSFFPISEYVKGEIKLVDSLPVGIMKKIIKGASRDSSFIERPEFHILARDFTHSTLDKSSLETKYTEHSFMDETTGYYTFTYEPIATDAPYQRIDVLVKPGASFDKVSSIYLQRSSILNDTAINERFYWKANTSFTITKEKKYKDQNPAVEQLMVIWDPSAY